ENGHHQDGPGAALIAKPAHQGDSASAQEEAVRVTMEAGPGSAAGRVTVTQSSPPLCWRVADARGNNFFVRQSTLPALSPREAARAALDAASCTRSCVVASCPPARQSARTSTTAGIAVANSAVTAPRSPRCVLPGKSEGTLDQVGENRAHLLASHDDDQQAGEPDGCHDDDRVLGCCCSRLALS